MENLTNDTPPKRESLFFLYKNPRQSRPEALLEGYKNFRESAFSGTFSSLHTFCTPPYHGPNANFESPVSSPVQWVLMAPHPMCSPFDNGFMWIVRPFAPPEGWPPLFVPWVTMGGPTIGRWGHPSAQPIKTQRRRNDNINKICILEGVGEGENLWKFVQNAVFPEKFHDNKIWKFCEFYCQKFCCHLGGS